MFCHCHVYPAVFVTERRTESPLQKDVAVIAEATALTTDESRYILLLVAGLPVAHPKELVITTHTLSLSLKTPE